MKVCFLLIFCFILETFIFINFQAIASTYPSHKHSEASYQTAHCQSIGGIIEYELPNKTRVDCLTDNYAIEYDYAKGKYYECYTQALYYSMMTGKRAKCVLIVDGDKKQAQKQLVYSERLNQMNNYYNLNVEIEIITDDILNLDKYNKCNNINCKCHKYK